MYQSGKTYGHEVGFSCAFRQHRASSHCRFVHGYALGFKFVFEASELDANGWVVDFGSLKQPKQLLEALFDHKLLVASDDPEFNYFLKGRSLGVFDFVEVPGVGCENFAKMAFSLMQEWVVANYGQRVKLVSVTVSEHGANHATYINPELDITKRGYSNYEPLIAGDSTLIAGKPITLDDLNKEWTPGTR